MRRIAFINEKGGTGKTTLAVNTAAYFAQHKGLRVLLVDLDTQGHAGKALGIDARTVRPNVFDLLTTPRTTLAQVARPTSVERLWVVPSYKEMSQLPVVLAQDERRAYRLSDRLSGPESRAYDVVMFDSPPSMGLATTNILVAASEVVVPVGLTYFALDGCAEVAETVRQVAEQHHRPQLRITRVVPTMARNTALGDEILSKLREHFPGLVSEPLGFNVKIDEAQSYGRTIWEYAPASRGAEMLRTVAESVFLAGADAASSPATVAGATAASRSTATLP